MYSKSPIINIIYLFTYSVLTALTVAVFYIFFPFKYVDPINSSLICENNYKFPLNSVVVFSVDGTLDAFNDLKARKQCANNVIMDYHSVYPDPGKVDYKLAVSYAQESSYLEALLAIIIFFTSGVLLIESFFYYISKVFKGKKNFNFVSFYINIISFFVN